MTEEKKHRSDIGKERVPYRLQTYTFTLRTTDDAHIIEAIESGEGSRSSIIRRLLSLGVKKVKK